MSVLALKELEIIQRTGNPAYKAPITRSTRTPARARKSCRRRGVMSVTGFLRADVEDSQQQGDREDDRRARRGFAELVSAERELVREGAQHLRRIQRATAGRHPDESELLGRPDEVEQGHADDDRPQLREGDEHEPL